MARKTNNPMQVYRLIKANNRYYIITGIIDTPIEWILISYGEVIVTLKSRDTRAVKKALYIVGLIDFIQNSLQNEKVYNNNQ